MVMMTMMMEALVTWPGTVATILMSGSAEVLALGRDPDLVIKIMIKMITKITLMLDGHGDDDDYVYMIVVETKMRRRITKVKEQ